MSERRKNYSEYSQYPDLVPAIQYLQGMGGIDLVTEQVYPIAPILLNNAIALKYGDRGKPIITLNGEPGTGKTTLNNATRLIYSKDFFVRELDQEWVFSIIYDNDGEEARELMKYFCGYREARRFDNYYGDPPLKYTGKHFELFGTLFRNMKEELITTVLDNNRRNKNNPFSKKEVLLIQKVPPFLNPRYDQVSRIARTLFVSAYTYYGNLEGYYNWHRYGGFLRLLENQRKDGQLRLEENPNYFDPKRSFFVC